MHKSMGLKYEPFAEPLDISVKKLNLLPLSRKHGTDETVRAILWPWLSGGKNETGDIRKSINHIKDLHSKIITEVSQKKSKGRIVWWST